MSSLLKQLLAISDKTGSVSLDRKSRSKIHSKSLIFDPKTASAQDYDYLFQVGVEGLEELIDIDTRFSKFRLTLFSETSVTFDRNVQTQDVIDSLDKNVEAFLCLTSRYLSLSPTVKAIEWLVRRYHINIHNAEVLLLTSLSYYDAPIFLKVLNVIPKQHIPAVFEWIKPTKDLLKNPSSASILKIFRSSVEFFKLYSMFIQDQLDHGTLFKGQLMFFLANTIQTMGSFSRNIENFLEMHLPIVLEAVGKFLSPDVKVSSAMKYEIKLSAYSMISVVSALVPFNQETITALTETALQDEFAMESMARQTLILLGQLWDSFDYDNLEVKPFQKLILANKVNLISEIKQEGYKVNGFLITYFLNNLSSADSVELYNLIDTGKESEYQLILSEVLNYVSKESRKDVSYLSNPLKNLFACSPSMFTETMKKVSSVLTISDLEIRLMTTIADDRSVSSELEGIDEPEEPLGDVPESTNDDIEKVESKWNHGKCSSKTFFSSESDEEFWKIQGILLEHLKTIDHKSFAFLLKKFVKYTFSSIDCYITFLVRLVFTPSVPLRIRLVSLRFVKSRLKELKLYEKSIDTYLLTPFSLLGLSDKQKLIRQEFGELLRVLHNNAEKLHQSKNKSKTTLFMEEQIYDQIPNNKRAIIQPQDALFMLDFIIKNQIIEEAIVDDATLAKNLFEKLFKAQKPNLKKLGHLILKTFVLNQWSLSQLSLVLKYSVWHFAGAFNSAVAGSDDRFFFLESQILPYFDLRPSYMTEAKNISQYFFELVEQNVLLLVGGSSLNSKNEAKEVDWLLNALKLDGELLRATGSRLVDIFDKFKLNESKAKIAGALIDLLVSDDEAAALSFDPLDILHSLSFDLETLLAVLSSVQIVSQVPEQGAVKRRRRSSSSTRQAMAKEEITSLATMHLKKLSIVLDLLEANLKNHRVIAKPDLLQSLLKILTDLEYLGNDGDLPVFYAQETLASCMHLTVSHMTDYKDEEEFNIDSTIIRADLIVNSIRSCQSPQVQNRLLLVIADLATICPEIVLHSVMPIFTFMGAHTIRQDDEFSNLALQQTVSKVAPVLAGLNSKKSENEIEFLLTSFAAAFNHIPRHRRLKLFTSLTNTLEPANSLHLIMFLIGQQYSDYSSRHKKFEARDLIEFGSNYIKSFSAEEQLEGFLKYQELWDIIPVEEVEANSEEFNRLIQRPIFGASIASASKSTLINLKSRLTDFVKNVILENDKDTKQSLKLEVAVLLMDDMTLSEDKEKLLDLASRVISLILIKVEELYDVAEFSNVLDNLYTILEVILDILPLSYFVESVTKYLDFSKISTESDVKIACNFAILAGKKIENECNSNNINDGIKNSVLKKLLPMLMQAVGKEDGIELQQAYLDTFAITVTKFGSSSSAFTEPENSQLLVDFLKNIAISGNLTSDKPELVVSSVNAILSAVSILGIKSIGMFPLIVPPIFKVWDNIHIFDSEGANFVQASILSLLTCYVKKMPAFMTSSLNRVLLVTLKSDSIDSDIRTGILRVITDHMDLRDTIKSLCNIWTGEEFYKVDSPTDLGLYLNTLLSCIDRMDKKTASSQAGLFFKWLTEVFEFRHYAEINDKFDNNTIHRLESVCHECAINYVFKLNDKAFRPLFASLVRWAMENPSLQLDGKNSRLIAFFRFFNKMQEQLKGIITSYYSYFLDSVASLLQEFSEGKMADTTLRRLVLISLTSSFKYDQDDYWSQNLRFETICDPLLSQLSNIEDSIGKYLVKALSAFVAAVASNEYNEKLVNGFITYISNENGRTSSNSKIWTVRCLKSVFQKSGEQWLSYLPTLIPYIAELLDDEDEEVELEVRKGLVRVIETVLGEPLDRYLS